MFSQEDMDWGYITVSIIKKIFSNSYSFNQLQWAYLVSFLIKILFLLLNYFAVDEMHFKGSHNFIQMSSSLIFSKLFLNKRFNIFFRYHSVNVCQKLTSWERNRDRNLRFRLNISNANIYILQEWPANLVLHSDLLDGR